MGRELKRVALDFEWPRGKVWEGYINPHYAKCPESGKTCFNGENAAAKYLGHITAMLGVIGDDARRGSTHPYCNSLPYYGDHPNWAIQPKEVREKMVSLIEKLTGRAPSPLGFGGSDHEIFFNILKMAGIENKGEDKAAYMWTHCSVCKGEHVDPAVKEKYDAWKEFEPPQGPGYQLWETTSEGSPVSPVFQTLDELCAWCETNASTFGDSRTSAANWKKMLDDGLVSHTEGNIVFI